MALFGSLVGAAQPEVPIHGLMASFWLLHRGYPLVPNKNAILNNYGLSTNDADMQVLVDKYTSLAADRKEPFLHYLFHLLVLAQDKSYSLDTRSELVAEINRFS